MYFTKYILESYLHISSSFSFILLCPEYRMTKKYVFLQVFCQQVSTGCDIPLRIHSFANTDQQQQIHFSLQVRNRLTNQYPLLMNYSDIPKPCHTGFLAISELLTSLSVSSRPYSYWHQPIPTRGCQEYTLCCRRDQPPACHCHVPGFSRVEMTGMTDSHILLLPNLVKQTFLYCCSQATLTTVSQEAMTSSWPQLAHSLFIKVQISFASLGNSRVSLWESFNTTSPP